LISREQALKAGMSSAEWRWLASNNNWRRVYAGVYGRVGAPQTWEQALMAGCLSGDAIASHRAAGALWRLPEIEPRLEVIIPQRRKVVLEGFEVHRTTFVQPVDRRRLNGIPVTSLARTAIDLSLEMPAMAPGLVDHLIAKRKVPLALLSNRLEAMGTKGRKGAGELLDLLEERKGRRRHVDSGLQRRFEKIALDAYRAGLLPEPFFEYPVQLSDGRWRYPDTAYPYVSTGFEALSYEHHSTLPDWAADIERNIDLFGEGWLIVPVTEIKVRDPVRLVAQMARIIAVREAHRT
jgi:hypothetical protein